MVMCPECAPADVTLTRQCQREMPFYQSVTIPLRQLNRVVRPEAKGQDQLRRGGECGSLS
jgi:hypothetical protein